jgi:L-fucose isomerase
MANRLIGSLPKIGVRPTIDGRRGGVRESLEEQTMAMAVNVAELLSRRLRHASGEPVECVVADTCIGGVAEAAACKEKFRDANVGLTITVTPCWCYGSETIDMDPHLPKAIWGFNGTERPGAVFLAAALAGHNQKGLPAFSIYGQDVQDAVDTAIPKDVEEKLLRFARCGLTVATMRGKSYLSIGSVSMGIAGSIVDEGFFKDYLDMRNEYVDMSEMARRMELGILDSEEQSRAMAWVKDNCKEGTDLNPAPARRSKEDKDEIWSAVVRMTLIARDLMVGNRRLTDLGYGEEALGRNAILAGFQGQRHWTDHRPNGDFTEAILNTTFDWNGVRQPYLMATENDSLNGVCMLFGHLLSGTAQIFADVRTYWSPDAVMRLCNCNLPGPTSGGFLHLINSGSAALDGTGRQRDAAGKPALKHHADINENDVNSCLAATRWSPAIEEYFRGGGFSSQYLTRGGIPFTLSRLNLIQGLGPVIQIAEGHSLELPSEVHDVLDKRTNPTWPTTWFAPRLTGRGTFRDVYSVMANWGANHGVLTYDHVGADLLALAAILRIPVSMHNVDESKVFRPSYWSAFGMDLEGQDYRACAVLGPLYR